MSFTWSRGATDREAITYSCDRCRVAGTARGETRVLVEQRAHEAICRPSAGSKGVVVP